MEKRKFKKVIEYDWGVLGVFILIALSMLWGKAASLDNNFWVVYFVIIGLLLGIFILHYFIERKVYWEEIK